VAPKAVLLVDDSKRDTEAMEILLRSIGVTIPILAVDGGNKAIAYFKGDGEYADRAKYPLPSVLLLDLKMPEPDGFYVLEWLKAHSHLKDSLVVVLSAYDGLREVNQAYALGSKSFLVKPCSAADIKDVIKSFPDYWAPAFPYTDNPGGEARTDRL